MLDEFMKTPAQGELCEKQYDIDLVPVYTSISRPTSFPTTTQCDTLSFSVGAGLNSYFGTTTQKRGLMVSDLAPVKPEDTVASVMTSNPITIEADAPVRKALQVMIKKDIGSLLVVRDGEPVGIVTERDVTRRSLRAAKIKGIYDRPVARSMSRPLVTVPANTPIWDAFEAMVTRKIRRLPVVEQGRLIGIVTERDLFRWVIRVFYEPNIPERIKKFL
jgi:CBS domain-containing protein